MRARCTGVVGLALATSLVIVAAAPASAYHEPGDHGVHAAPSATAAGKQGLVDRATAISRARQKPVYLEAKLNGANEVPGPAGAPAVGDPDGAATGLVKLQGDRVSFAFTWRGIEAPTLGHIHQGVAGVNGDVKVGLFTTGVPATLTAVAGVLTVTDAKVADAIRADPRGFYLNLHTAEFPGGAVRGQLTRLAQERDILKMLPGSVEKAFLSGDQEVPGDDGKAVGDPTGRAVVFVDGRDGQVAFQAAWFGITPTLGHVHRGVAGRNGPVVVALFATEVPATIVAVAGVARDVDGGLIKEMDTRPAEFYANLHTAEFPGGAVRGQLFKRR